MPEPAPGAIVCVDDEPTVLALLRAQLSPAFPRHPIECAPHGQAALELIERIYAQGRTVDLVISDQMMPGLPGDRFLEELHRRRPETLKILLTARATAEAVGHAINHAGLNRFMAKPWDAQDLRMAVSGLLAQQGLRRDLEAQRARLLRMAEEQVRSAPLTTLGRMLAGLAHDLRNPITAIRAYGALLAGPELPRPRQEECGRQVVAECDRLNAMLQDLLEFSRGDGQPLHLAECRVDQLVEEVRRSVLPSLQESGVRFEADLAWPGPARVDAERLRRALVNLATNALDAMPRGGRLRVASARRGELLELRVEDDGPGIPHGIRDRVFEPFFTHGKPRGTGLGLFIAQRIVLDHGGRIGVESQPGEGTAVILALPALDPEAAQ